MSNHAAYVDEKGARITVREAPYPELKPGYIILMNEAVALNPIDWKLQDFGFLIQSWPTILGMYRIAPVIRVFVSSYISGSDVAGEIVELGAGVEHLKKGQRVIGHTFALLTGKNSEAAFQQYTLVPGNMIAPIPDDMAYATAAVLPLSVSCASAALYEKNSLGLPLPNSGSKADGNSILIWGGSSSVGSSAIQLARASGIEVIATASAKNFDYVKDLGASTVLDYAHPEIISELVEALRDSHCVGAFDTVGMAIPQCVEVIKQLGGGHVVATSDPPAKLPAGVTANHGQLGLESLRA